MHSIKALQLLFFSAILYFAKTKRRRFSSEGSVAYKLFNITKASSKLLSSNKARALLYNSYIVLFDALSLT